MKYWIYSLCLAGLVLGGISSAKAQDEAVNELGDPVVLEGPLDNPDDMEEVNTDIQAAEDYIAIVDEPTDTTDGQREFALSFAAASRAGEMRDLWALVHPESRACLTETEKLFIEQENFAYLLGEPIETVKMTQVNRVLENDVKSLFRNIYGEGVTIPVMPTHSLQIHHERSNGACEPIVTTRLVYVREVETDDWREVMPCNAVFPVTAAEAAAMKQAHDAEIESLFNALDSDTKQRFRSMVREGRKIEAIKEIATLTERDMSVAKGVAEKFCYY